MLWFLFLLFAPMIILSWTALLLVITVLLIAAFGDK